MNGARFHILDRLVPRKAYEEEPHSRFVFAACRKCRDKRTMMKLNRRAGDRNGASQLWSVTQENLKQFLLARIRVEDGARGTKKIVLYPFGYREEVAEKDQGVMRHVLCTVGAKNAETIRKELMGFVHAQCNKCLQIAGNKVSSVLSSLAFDEVDAVDF